MRDKIQRIIKLNRDPKAPDVHTLEMKKSTYGFVLRRCPGCGEWEHHKNFYRHWTYAHSPNWKLDMIMQEFLNVIQETSTEHWGKITSGNNFEETLLKKVGK